MTSDEQRRALLQAILDAPDDDLPRLVLADWLEENASVRRVPCPTCSPYRDQPCPTCDGRKKTRSAADDWYDNDVTCPTCEGTGKFLPGYHPQRDVGSGRHEGGWTNCKTCNSKSADVTPGVIMESGWLSERAAFIRKSIASPDGYSCDAPAWKRWPDSFTSIVGQDAAESFAWEWRRGFVQVVRAPLAALLEHGPKILQAHPVTRMEVVGKEPARQYLDGETPSGQFGWFRVGDGGDEPSVDELPSLLWWDLVGGENDRNRWRWYASREAALEALHQVVLALCRQWAEEEMAKAAGA